VFDPKANPQGSQMNIAESFVILKYVNKTPSLASCANCQRKFFTPSSYYRDPLGAEQYLREKFDDHNCPEEPKRGPGWPTQRNS
jgi:hypothetical protein